MQTINFIKGNNERLDQRTNRTHMQILFISFEIVTGSKTIEKVKLRTMVYGEWERAIVVATLLLHNKFPAHSK